MNDLKNHQTHYVKMRFSIIIPTLNEADRIAAQINHIKRLNESAEIIIADGGSRDETTQIAKNNRAKIVQSIPGRGTQQRKGAMSATGDVLVFLHADTVLPHDAFTVMTDFFNKPDNLVATFRVRFHPPYLVLRLISVFTRLDTVITKFGDQCIVIRRDLYKQLGGFPKWPLFEDVYLLDKARKYTTIRSLPGIVISSSRRFKKNGVLRQLIWNAWLILLYYVGRPTEKLAEMYRRKL